MSFHASLTSSQATALLSETLALHSGFAWVVSVSTVEARRCFVLSAVFDVNGEAGGVIGSCDWHE